jgi:hypothetical protein
MNEHHICEMYLFDKQGSCIFLDEEANLSWLFVRNETGIENSIKLAEQYHAPTSVISALKEKQVILSLYEKEDFERRKIIDWDQYLLPATVFTGDDKYITSFKLNPHSNYYYAFTNKFPDHGIEQDKILSYKAFLKQAT